MTRHTDIEFWLFVPQKPLPASEEIAQLMLQLDPCFGLKTKGNLETIEDHIIDGQYIDEEGDVQLDVSWSMETQDAAKAFKKDPNALKMIGSNKKMLCFLIEDECALGHVFAMMHALLSSMGGLLVIPEEGEHIILPQKQALAFLQEEIEADQEEWEDEE